MCVCKSNFLGSVAVKLCKPIHKLERNSYYSVGFNCRYILPVDRSFMITLFIDSEESARREMAFFFPEFDSEHWYTHEEVQCRNGTVSITNNRDAL